jgi:hypothetical protein
MHKSVSLPTKLGGAAAREQASGRQRGLSLTNLNSSAATQPATRPRAPEPRIVSGCCVIKAAPHAAKEMHVEFQVSQNTLKISFSQARAAREEAARGGQAARGDQQAPAHSFELCTLALEGLVVGWIWNDPRLFTVAAELRGELHHAIYCYPTDRSRNEWLRIFEGRGVRSAPFYHRSALQSNLDRVSETVSGGGSGSSL